MGKLKNTIKRTFLYRIYLAYKNKKVVAPNQENVLDGWINSGRPVPPPHLYKTSVIQDYASINHLNVFIETGTYLGEAIEANINSFKKLISVELSPELFERAKIKFAHNPKVELYEGDSGQLIKNILADITEPCLFWLDGHYSEGITAKGQLNTPIINELTHILNHPVKNHVILVDDARCFNGESDYPTLTALHRFVSGFDSNLIFTVKDDIIRIHPKDMPDLDNDSKNEICSAGVNPKSLLGHHIEVREQTGIDSESKVGSYTYIGKRVAITKSEIGRYCSIGDNVTIGPGEHDLNRISTSAYFYANTWEVLTSKDCLIGNDVWIGVDSVIIRGVKIGNGAVIGANSVVTKDVPPFAVVVGSPARVIKYRFEQEKIDQLTEANWWNLDLQSATGVLNSLS